jgi:SAM-dependent methyltransferase
MSEPDWRDANRAKWDERVGVHLGPGGYRLADLETGAGRLDPIAQAELPPVDGKRVLHLQCHFGADSLRLAQQGAEIVGLDFSGAAVAAARDLAAKLGLAGSARFVEADLYQAPAAVPLPHGFDVVFVTWGTIAWLPDVRRWATIIADMLRPGGVFYFAEGHPTAFVFDDSTATSDGTPGFFLPYFTTAQQVYDEATDYADPDARLVNTRSYEWQHTIGAVLTALRDAGLTLDWFHEHDAVPWRMFQCLVCGEDRLWRWPDNPWLPLAYSLLATKP